MTDCYNFGMEEALLRLKITPQNYGATTGQQWLKTTGKTLTSHSPSNGKAIASVKQASLIEYHQVVKQATEAFKIWREIPAPQRGDIVRQMGNALRKHKADLGRLVSYEMGKILEEGMGEVQEMIDIADFALGISRQLYGFTMHSERPGHRMYDQYHPLGVVGVITAFNFPVAVWAWNAMLALVCGDTVIWKPSSKVPLSALAVHHIIHDVLADNDIPEGVVNLVIGQSSAIGDPMLNDKNLPLISCTGSVKVGRHVAQLVGERLGRTLLELGGNNAIIITPHANIDMALKATLFGAVGTAGQRCTSTRRLIIHESIYDNFKARLIKAYEQITTGCPLSTDTLVGPLIDAGAVEDFIQAIQRVKEQGGSIAYGGQKLNIASHENGHFVSPCIAEVPGNLNIVKQETFAPLLYLMKYSTFDQAMALHNGVPQGLSSAIFSNHLAETEKFLSATGSDCGIANVNIGTSGAEIGGAFGGEKETGGGRESGSDAWKIYMRRQTNTINYSNNLPFAQGIKFVL